MPFTFAHPAIVLPLRKICGKRTNFCAAILGSIAPDFGYYIHFWNLSSFAHTLLGSVLVDVPISLFFLLVLIKIQRPVANLFPQPHKGFWIATTINDDRQFSWTPGTTATLLVFILVGTWSHIAWDSFTHSSGWCVLAAPLLFMHIVKIENIEIPVFKLLQYGRSLFGIAAILTFYWRSLRDFESRSTASDETQKDGSDKLRMILIIVGSALLAAAASYTSYVLPDESRNLRQTGFNFLVNWISFFCLTLIVTALVNESLMTNKRNQDTKKPPR
jgi:hypothetical protein